MLQYVRTVCAEYGGEGTVRWNCGRVDGSWSGMQGTVGKVRDVEAATAPGS